MPRLILIDSINKEVREVECNGLQDMYKHLKCDMVQCVRLRMDLDCWIDEEGRCKTGYIDDDGVRHNLSAFTFPGLKEPIMGNGLLASNLNGETISPPVSIERVREHITFVDYDHDEHKPQPSFTIFTFDPPKEQD